LAFLTERELDAELSALESASATTFDEIEAALSSVTELSHIIEQSRATLPPATWSGLGERARRLSEALSSAAAGLLHADLSEIHALLSAWSGSVEDLDEAAARLSAFGEPPLTGPLLGRVGSRLAPRHLDRDPGPPRPGRE
jgi:hypothetical protein